MANVFPYAADEYDDYAPMLVEALRAHASAAYASWTPQSSPGTKPPSDAGTNSGPSLANWSGDGSRCG